MFILLAYLRKTCTKFVFIGIFFIFGCSTTKTFTDNSIEKVLTPLQEKCILSDSEYIECPKDVLNESLNLCIDIWGDLLACKQHVAYLDSELSHCQTKPKKWHESRILWATIGAAIGTILGLTISLK
jgi:hypothetical protein